MIDIVILTFVLSMSPKSPTEFSSEEKLKDICFNSVAAPDVTTLTEFRKKSIADTMISSGGHASAVRDFSSGVSVAPQTTEEFFRQFATEWQEQARFDSSTTDATNRPAYRAIVKLGWEVVPFLLKDVKNKKGFWFPALAEITGIRPFDKGDAGNVRRMAHAWIAWGKKKGLVV
jgi:hypothetical protein